MEIKELVDLLIEEKAKAYLMPDDDDYNHDDYSAETSKGTAIFRIPLSELKHINPKEGMNAELLSGYFYKFVQ